MAAGYEVTVLEASGNVGGVWKANYAGYKLQVNMGGAAVPAAGGSTMCSAPSNQSTRTTFQGCV
jgi:hypothetical protein